MKLTPKTKKKILAGTILIVLAVIVTFGSVFAVNHFRGPVRLVNRYVDAVNTQNATELCECLPPSYQSTVKELIQEAGGDKAFFQKAYANMFNQDTPYESFGENITISVSNTVAEDQTITDGKYKGLDVSKLEVTAVTTVTCTMTTKGSEREVSETVEVVCIKIGSKWYMLNMSTVAKNQAETPTDVQ